jgi:recombination protein RecA
MAKKESVKISDVVANVKKRFGDEAIAGVSKNVEWLNTGSIGLNQALGGGWAKGRIVELFGWESSGKSTLALHASAECQKEGKVVAYIDMEHALDPFYAEALGVDTSEKSGLWYLSQPDDGETALEIVREFAKSDEVGLIVVDSVSALLPRAVIAGEAGDQKIGLLARLMSQMVPTLIAPAKKSGAVIMFIGQLREKIGISWGDPSVTTGGNALKFYSSQRAQVARSGQDKDGDEIVANGTRVKVIKNKVAPPFKQTKFFIEFGTGIDKLREVIDVAVELGIINKKGAGWMSYGDTKLGQGVDAVKILLEDNPELLEEIQEKINEELNK